MTIICSTAKTIIVLELIQYSEAKMVKIRLYRSCMCVVTCHLQVVMFVVIYGHYMTHVLRARRPQEQDQSGNQAVQSK